MRRRPDGWDAVYTLNGELYRSQWCAAKALARADLAMTAPISFVSWMASQ